MLESRDRENFEKIARRPRFSEDDERQAQKLARKQARRKRTLERSQARQLARR